MATATMRSSEKGWRIPCPLSSYFSLPQTCPILPWSVEEALAERRRLTGSSTAPRPLSIPTSSTSWSPPSVYMRVPSRSQTSSASFFSYSGFISVFLQFQTPLNSMVPSVLGLAAVPPSRHFPFTSKKISSSTAEILVPIAGLLGFQRILRHSPLSRRCILNRVVNGHL